MFGESLASASSQGNPPAPAVLPRAAQIGSRVMQRPVRIRPSDCVTAPGNLTGRRAGIIAVFPPRVPWDQYRLRHRSCDLCHGSRTHDMGLMFSRGRACILLYHCRSGDRRSARPGDRRHPVKHRYGRTLRRRREPHSSARLRVSVTKESVRCAKPYCD